MPALLHLVKQRTAKGMKRYVFRNKLTHDSTGGK